MYSELFFLKNGMKLFILSKTEIDGTLAIFHAQHVVYPENDEPIPIVFAQSLKSKVLSNHFNENIEINNFKQQLN